MLKFKTDGQELFYLDGGDVIVGDTIRYLEAEFDLSDDWKSFPEVTAYFKCGAAINSIILVGGKIKAEDNLALAPGVWSVYLRAYELEGEEIKRQITSSTVKINVLSHGKFTGREFVPENADAYEKRMTEMRNYLVFEEYNPDKTYVKGNKVAYEGSSYVLTADSAMGTNPTDSEAWLLIAEKGNDGTRIFEFPFEDYGAEVGRTYEIGSLSGLEDFYGQTIPGIDSWRVGDYFLSEDGKMLIIEGMIKEYGVVRFITVRCLADIKGKDGKDGEKGTTIHTVNFGLSKANPVGVRYSNYWRGVGMYLDFTMPKGFVEGDLLFDGDSGLMLNHSTASYSTTEHGETIMVTYDVITIIANLNGSDGDAGLAGEGGGAFKRIGFTEDCDYIATSDDGRTAFVNAINDAVEGDVIMVMPGYYGGTADTPINKDITFVGIGKPRIAFSITIGTTSQAYSVNFDNFHFVKAITCTKVDEYTSSKFYAYNSRFDGNTVTIIGSFSNCKIDYAKVYGSLPYYGDSSLCSIEYCDCDIANSTLNGDSVVFRNCVIRESPTPQGYDASYSDCSLYNFQGKMGTAYQTYFNRCVIYGTSIPTSDYGPYYYECSLVSGESL